MIPIGDDNRHRVRWPVVTAALLATNVAVFLYELSLQERHPLLLETFLYQWGVVPLEYARGIDLEPVHGLPVYSTLVTSMFLHAGWGHLLGNMLYLWVFGDNVEDRFGRLPFVLFYVAAGVVGSLAQILVNPASTVPTVGASGAISGILGAYVVMFPTNRVQVLFFILLYEVPAFLVIGLWAVTQLINGYGQLGMPDGGGVAYLAHIGGFVTGVAGALLYRMTTPGRRLARSVPGWRRG